MKKLGFITDDMTGTMTCGALLAKAGIQACSYFSPYNMPGAEKQEAVIISANSRNLPPEQAKRKVKEAYHALLKQKTTFFTKRIDTTFRGGIGYEVDALLEEMPSNTIAVMAAAMPDTHRIVVGGYSIINGVILTETGAASDAMSPVKQAHIPTLIRSQSNNQVEEIGLNKVLAGKAVLREALIAKKNSGGKIIIVDAITTEHLHMVAQVINELGWNVLAIDPGAFSLQLALCRGFGNFKRIPKHPENFPDAEGYAGKVIVVAGSATDVTRKQINMLRGKEYVECVSIYQSKLIKTDTDADMEINRAVSEGIHRIEISTCKVLVLGTAIFNQKIDLKTEEKHLGFPKGRASTNINKSLGKIVNGILNAPFVKKNLKGLYMTGGDTLVTVLQAIGASGLHLIDTVIPQTNLGRIIGGPFEGTSIVGKGGMIGKEDTAILAVNRLFYETVKRS